MSESTTEPELKPEQIKILQDAYAYRDDAEYTEEDLKLAKQMFDTPEKFKLLRKIFGVHTPNERGITMPTIQAFVDADLGDLKKYAVETAVNHLADEKVRKALVNFYVLLRGNIRGEMQAEFDKENAEELKEKKQTEEFEAKQEEDKKIVGDNL